MSALAVLQQRAFETGRFDVGNLTQAVWSTAHGRFLEMTDLQGDADLAARRALRPARGAARAALVALAEPRHAPRRPGRRRRARRGAGLPARPQAPRRRVGGARLRARLPALPADAVARRRRLPSGRARDAAPARGDLVPRRGPPVAVRALRRRRVPDEGAGRARRRDARHLVRVRARAAAGRARHLRRRGARGGRSRRRSSSRTTRRAAGRRSRAATTRSAARPAGIVKTAVLHPLRARSRSRSSTATSATSGTSSRRSAGCRCSRRSSRSAPCPSSPSTSSRARATQSSIHFHYTAGAIPGLIAGAVLGGAQLRTPAARSVAVGRPRPRRARRSSPGIVLGPLPVWRHVPFGSELAARDHIVSEHDRAAARVIRAVPGRRARQRHQHPRRASLRAAAHLQLPGAPGGALGRGRPASGRATSTTRPARGSPRAYARFRQDRRWQVVRAEDGVIVLHKTAAG